MHLTANQVRLADENGVWLVQNPRSNRGNRVGYPSTLVASRHVALGTDGYPARMDDEVEALQQVAREHDDDPEAVSRRIAAGHDLAADRLGVRLRPLDVGGGADAVVRENGTARHVMVAGRTVVANGRLLTADIEAIREQARRQAPGVWARMAELA